jgi:hypothetical protein
LYIFLYMHVYKLRKATASFVMSAFLSVRMSVHPSFRKEQLASHWTDFHQIWYLSIFRVSVEKIQVSLKRKRMAATLRDAYQYTFSIISRSVLLRTRNISGKFCRENQNMYFTFNHFFPKSCLYKTMWKNILESDRP